MSIVRLDRDPPHDGRPVRPDEVAQRYNAHNRFLRLINWVPRSFRRSVARILAYRPNAYVVEYCSGWGANIPFILAEVGKHGRIHAVEIASRSHERSIRKHRYLGKNLNFVNADMFRFPVPEKTDAVLLSMCFTIVMQDRGRGDAFLRHVWESLPVGGRIVVFDATLRPDSSFRFTLPFWRFVMRKTLLGDPDMYPPDELKRVFPDARVHHEQLGRAHFVCWVEKS